jgi:hypothetical protein
MNMNPNWIFDLFRKGQVHNDTFTNRDQEWERKVKANAWIQDVMNTNESALSQEQQFQEISHLLMDRYGLTPADVSLDTSNVPMEMTAEEYVEAVATKYGLQDIRDTGLGMRQSSLQKVAAYELGESQKETLKKDYERDVKALSDYVLAEMLAEYRLQGKGLPENIIEEKEKTKKKVESSRAEAENELLKLVGDHTALDWKASFEKWRKVESVELKAEDVYTGAKPETGKQNWEKKEDYAMPSDKERIEGMAGIGAEEKKGQVGKEASLKKAEDGRKCPNPEEVEASPKQADHMEPHVEKAIETDIEHSIEEKHEQEAIECPYCAGIDLEKEAVAPPEWERTVKHVKEKHKDKVENPWALAWWMKGKGYEPSKERMPAHSYQEISNQASREEVIKKVAEVESPWKVIKDEAGQDVIARVEPETNQKESDEKEDETLKK